MRKLPLAILTTIGLLAASPLMAQSPQPATGAAKPAATAPAATAPAKPAAAPAAAADTKQELLDINSASAAQLEALMGVGKVGAEAALGGLGGRRKVIVTGVEMFQKTLDQGEAGDNVGALLRGVEREDIQRGQVLCKPGSINPHTKVKAEVYVLSKEEGGRHTPFFNGYRPQFYIRTTDVTGSITLPDGVEMVMPGDNVEMGVELITPVAIEDGLRFAIREGGRTVGAGVVTRIIE